MCQIEVLFLTSSAAYLSSGGQYSMMILKVYKLESNDCVFRTVENFIEIFLS